MSEPDRYALDVPALSRSWFDAPTRAAIGECRWVVQEPRRRFRLPRIWANVGTISLSPSFVRDSSLTPSVRRNAAVTGLLRFCVARGLPKDAAASPETYWEALTPLVSRLAQDVDTWLVTEWSFSTGRASALVNEFADGMVGICQLTPATAVVAVSLGVTLQGATLQVSDARESPARRGYSSTKHQRLRGKVPLLLDQVAQGSFVQGKRR